MSFLYVNAEKKLYYITLPKTASTFTSNILKTYYDFKPTTHELHEMYNSDKLLMVYYSIRNGHTKWVNPITYAGYTGFTIVRNPYERFISGYLNYGINQPFNEEVLNTPKKCILWQEKIKQTNYTAYTHIFCTLTHFVRGLNIVPIHFEGLDTNLREFLTSHGFETTPHENTPMNTTKNKDIPFYMYYDQFTLDFVNKTFEEDFINYGYPMFQTLKGVCDHFGLVNL